MITNGFTFEEEKTSYKYETYEWDRTWVHKANDYETPRVFYIGDSISWGTREQLAGICSDINFDGLHTSKSLDHPFFRETVNLTAAQLPKVDVVLFNHGHHSWHLDDGDEYYTHLKSFLTFLLDKFCGKPFFMLLSTYSSDEKRCERIKKRNEITLKIAEEYNLPVIDMYPVSEANRKKLLDIVHFDSEGYRELAKKLVSEIYSALPELKK